MASNVMSAGSRPHTARTAAPTTVTESAAYPMPAPSDDGRFTVGLTVDVGKVLAEHGYPPIRSGADYVRLQSALFDFLYTLISPVAAASSLLSPLADPGTTTVKEDRS